MFVAGFIGTPQMNFINAVVHKENGQYYVDMINQKHIPLPLERMKTFNEEFLDKEVVLGIRTRAIDVEGDAGYVKQGFKAKINLFEQLGEETNIYSSIDTLDKDLIITTTGLGRFSNSQEINISFDFTNVCFFNKEDETKLL